MLVEGCVQLTCPLYCLHLWISERQGCRVFDWPVRVQTLLGLWSSGDLFVTPAWGMLGVRAMSCESGWTQAGSLGVKRLGVWRNHRAGRHSLSVCVFLIRFPQQPTTPVSRGNNPASVCTCRPGQLCLHSFLAAFVHLGKQTASIGVLQAVGVLYAEAFSSSAASSPSPRRIQQTQVWVRITFWNMFD